MAVIPLTITGLKQAQADLEALNKEFDKVKNDPIQSKKIAKEFNNLSKAVDDATEELLKMNDAGQLVGTKFDDLNEVLFQTNEEILPLTSQIGEMEDRMYQLAAAGDVNSKEFKALQGETARLRKVIIDTDKSIDLLAENRGLSVFSTGLGQVGERLLALDFDGAAKDAEAMNMAVGNLGKAGSQALTGLFKTVGQVGKAFATIGTALVANPIFLIAAAVAGIIAVIGILLDKLGFLDPILNAIGDVFEYIGEKIDLAVQAIKDFLDWLGLTSFAAEDAARRQVEAFERIAEAAQKKSAEMIDGYEKEIRLANIAGEDTTRLEIEKQVVIRRTAEVRAEAIRGQIEANKITQDLDEEEVQALKDKLAEEEKLITDSTFEIKAIKRQSTQDEKNRLEQERQDAKAAYEKMLQDRRDFEQRRLQIAREIEDLQLELRQDGINKELEENRVKYERLIQDTLSNEEILQEEKDQIVALLKEQEFEKDKEIRAQYDAELQAAVDEANAARQEKQDAERQKEIDAQVLQGQKQLEKYQEVIDKQAAIDAAFAEAKANLQDELVGSFSALQAALEKEGIKAAGLQKTLALVDIATNTAKALSNIIAGASAAAAASGPAAPFVLAGYVASGIATVATAILSAKQALQSAPSIGGSGGSVGSVGGVSASAPTEPAQPSVNLFGQNNNANNLSSPQDVESGQEIIVKALVSETEITDTQTKIKKLTQAAAL